MSVLVCLQSDFVVAFERWKSEKQGGENTCKSLESGQREMFDFPLDAKQCLVCLFCSVLKTFIFVGISACISSKKICFHYELRVDRSITN